MNCYLFVVCAGLGKGSLSLLKNSLSSVFGSVGSITGSMSKSVALLSMDSDFIEQNAMKQQNAPTNAAAGVAAGVASAAKGFWGGLTGVIVDPIKGARSEGMRGLVKGIVLLILLHCLV